MTNKTKHNYEQLPGFIEDTILYTVAFKCRNYIFHRHVNYLDKERKFSCLRDLVKLKWETIEIVNKKVVENTYE